jgi:outer membrane protein W
MSIIQYFQNAMVAASAALLLAPAAAQAQDIYVKANLGYGFSAASGDQIIKDDKIQFISYGAGFLGGAGLGYYINDNVAFELGINYHLGQNFKEEEKEGSMTSTMERRGSGLQLTPSIVITTGKDDEIAPYARVGLLVGLMNQVQFKSKDEAEFLGVKVSTDQEVVHSGGVGLGGVAALGLDYNLSDNLAIFGEVQLTTFAYRPTKGELKVSKENGVDNLGDKPEREKSWEYTTNTNDVKPDNNKLPAIKHPFSAVGINLGVKIGF